MRLINSLKPGRGFLIGEDTRLYVQGVDYTKNPLGFVSLRLERDNHTRYFCMDYGEEKEITEQASVVFRGRSSRDKKEVLFHLHVPRELLIRPINGRHSV